MASQDVWKNLPTLLVELIAQKVEYVGDLKSFSYVCKSWNVAVCKLEPWLHSKYPCLLLAEDSGLDLSAVLCDMNNNPVNESKISEEDDILCSIHNLFRNNTSSTRGWFSLATQNIYHLDLPEATDKLIFGTNKEWLLTLGKDFQAKLLHPFSRQQHSLPPMLASPSHECNYNAYQEHHATFIIKVVMTSELPRLQHQDNSNDDNSDDVPVIMASYTEYGILGFARLGDKFWTNVELGLGDSAPGIEDMVYHKGKMYAIDYCGSIFMCDVHNKQWQHRAKKIARIPFTKDGWEVQSYLIESLSGTHIWVVLRFREGESYKETSLPRVHGKINYYTTSFKVFKLELRDSSFYIESPACFWKFIVDLSSEALFIGRNSSVSVASSKYIKPNSIYFSDDCQFLFQDGGGHDMGIFDIGTGKIEPYFQGVSIHNISPSLWCM